MSAALNDTLATEGSAGKPAGSMVEEIRDALGQIARSKGFIPLSLAIVAIFAFFWPLTSGLISLWIEDDHYSHGFIIPLISGYVVWKWWPRISAIPVKPGYAGALMVAAMLYVGSAAMRVDQRMLASFALVAAIMGAIWFIAGFRWMLATAFPVLFLIFMLPVWISFIDVYTLPLQLISTKGAYHILNLLGQQPTMDAMHPTDIYLNNFSMTIAVPCSGMKLLLAITAFTAFFLMITDLRFWAKAVMVLIMIPLSLATNAIRIAMIGLVGNAFGDAAGRQFHDWSGYIALIFCFFVLFKIARGLGWKD